MELKAYLTILQRRLWIVVLIFGIVAIYVGYNYYTGHKTVSTTENYTSITNIRIGLSSDTTSSGNFSDYSTVSDNMADEFTTGPTLTTPAFGQQVIQQIHQDTNEIEQRYGTNTGIEEINDPKAIISAITKTRSHTLVTIAVTWNTQAGAWAVAHAIGQVTEANAAQYIDYEVRKTPAANSSTNPTVAAQVVNDASDPVSTTTVDTTNSSKKLLLAMLVVGLIIGLALAFLVEYLDDRIRTTEEIVRALQLPAYGEIPQAPTPGKAK